MKKIMFDDHYGLTQAVLDGRKTMTRRVIPEKYSQYFELGCGEVKRTFNEEYQSFTFWQHTAGSKPEDGLIRPTRFVEPIRVSPFKKGEEVAIAESYESLANSHYCSELGMMDSSTTFKKDFCGEGWKNKMFVKASLMPHRIRITGIKVERLQDISDEDCMREGIFEQGHCFFSKGIEVQGGSRYYSGLQPYPSPKDAFHILINKVSGKGTWEKNPYVFVYSFELVK